MKKVLIAAAFLFWAAKILFAQQTEIQFLSGHGKDDAVPWKFFCTGGAQSGYWTNLVVPSNWELHGFGTLTYHRDAPDAESGLYEHEFSVPKNWDGKRIFLVFDGAMTDTSAKINGHSAGPTHQGGYYQFKYDITSLVKFGDENKLEVTVAKHSANASVNGAERTGDFWMYGGIFRPVYLEAVPRQFIERVAIDAKADGNFSAEVFLNGLTNAWQVEAQIQTLAGKNIGKPFAAPVIAGGGRPDMANLQTQITSPKLWSAEMPNLYQVRIRLKQNGKTVHEISRRFGFRTFEVRDGDGLYLNGRRIVLKGCDRHSFWPDSGRCLSEAVQRLDIETIKDANMNAVRMSHYPPDAQFLDLCDQLGLYVLDELAGWHHAYDNETGTKLVKEMVTHDANHPSILFWDNGNEGGFNTNLDNLFGKYDLQQRRVLHPWAPFSGMNTAHYLPYDFTKLACEGWPITFHKNNYFADTNSPRKFIYMPTEFMHGLYDGGAGAGFAEVWNLMSHSKYLGGGFIWAFLDEGVNNPFTGTIDVAGNQAPDGIVGPYRQREGSFYTIKKIWSPIQITPETNGVFVIDRHYRMSHQTNGVFDIENHFSFTDAKDCQFEWQLRKFSTPDAKGDFKILATGKINGPEIPPGGKGLLRLHLPKAEKHADALALRVSDPHGRQLWTYVWPWREEKILPENVGVISQADFYGTNGGMMELEGKGIDAQIENGELVSVERDGKKFSLANGPRIATTNSVLKHVSWKLRDDGWLQCDYTYSAEGTNDFFGVVFDYPENLVKSKRWLGDGPYRVWKNRREGVELSVWQNDYNNTITGWRDWIYPEFKGCFANVRWLQLQTAEGEITVVPKNIPFVQVLTPEFPPAKLGGNTTPSLPDCGLGFLNAIPPVGSKFQRAEVVSPSGERAAAHGDYHGAVSFYFGNLP
ncbi:MAG TPA: glycoside hydrolase family 2 TIM barrel-domain containing protein [Verrucomicrobiae bacterium]|nr:glycoside hydrolase family 2 TIM barrel-domain containing protein [Verrucomicrobiae bacterium]